MLREKWIEKKQIVITNSKLNSMFLLDSPQVKKNLTFSVNKQSFISEQNKTALCILFQIIMLKTFVSSKSKSEFT